MILHDVLSGLDAITEALLSERLFKSAGLFGDVVTIVVLAAISGVTLVSCLGDLVVLAVSTKYLSAAFPFIIAVVYLIQKFYIRMSRQLRYIELKSKAPLYSHFLETSSGIATTYPRLRVAKHVWGARPRPP